ncbi:hypothetical protein FDC22_17500 [Clostridium botulinum]|nr:hypothetical protein CFSAN001628_018709 [Clostridium botulinum CFSAN001628]NFD73737.1 hypothetical protein [Clostridium botulinum]NFD80510.1 hypothetical protein [Clostridium botulinum]NFD90204.1 hypothetical protein [Clostridium botulinum]NFE21098.1 hypothetical protein [Clostridium botulinum]
MCNLWTTYTILNIILLNKNIKFEIVSIFLTFVKSYVIIIIGIFVKGRVYMGEKIIYVNFKKRVISNSYKRPFLLFLHNFLRKKLLFFYNKHLSKSIKLIYYKKNNNKNIS